MLFRSYWNGKNVKIPEGAGFTSGALVRPLVFSTLASQLPDGSGSEFSSGGARTHYAHTLVGVPVNIAHAILNRCKSVSLSGSINYSVERSTKKCDGPTSSKCSWTSEINVGCPPGNCMDTGGSITISCVSAKQTTKVALAGNINATAKRYRQLTDIWSGKPISLDTSLNYLCGTSANNVSLYKITEPLCYPNGGGPFNPVPKVNKIAKYDVQEKLSSGCLVYPHANANFLTTSLGENLKETSIS